jgi:hypothetical protein
MSDIVELAFLGAPRTFYRMVQYDDSLHRSEWLACDLGGTLHVKVFPCWSLNGFRAALFEGSLVIAQSERQETEKQAVASLETALMPLAKLLAPLVADSSASTPAECLRLARDFLHAAEDHDIHGDVTRAIQGADDCLAWAELRLSETEQRDTDASELAPEPMGGE